MKPNKSFDYVAKFKYLMLIPIVLVLAAVIIGSIFNLNYDYDYQKVSNFTVKFNTTVTESEYTLLEDNLEELIEKANIEDYRMERIGTGAQNGIYVRVANNDGNLIDTIEDLKKSITNDLLSNAGGKITSSVVVSTTDTNMSYPLDSTKLIWMSLLAVVCIMIFTFVYNFIRYNLLSGVSIVLTIALGVTMLLSGMIAFRIPFNSYFAVAYFIMILSTILFTTLINNNIKSHLNVESYSKYTNKKRVLEATKQTIKPISLLALLMLVVVLSLMFFGGLSMIFLGLAVILGLGISLFVSVMFYTSIWSFWYKKDKDSILRRRIENDNKKLEKKSQDEEKIVV
jgi:preprotein translocase subunit SecF